MWLMFTYHSTPVLPDGQKKKVPRETKKVQKKVPTQFDPKLALSVLSMGTKWNKKVSI